jgi:hypothetical protein
MLIWTIDKFVRPGVRGICYEHFYFLGGFSPTIIYAPGNPEVLLLIGCHRLGAAADLWTRAVASRSFDVLQIQAIFSSIRGSEHFVLCGLADAWRLFPALLLARTVFDNILKLDLTEHDNGNGSVGARRRPDAAARRLYRRIIRKRPLAQGADRSPSSMSCGLAG